MTDQLFILILFFLTGFSGLVFYLFGNEFLNKIKIPGLFFALGTLGGTVFFHLIPEYVEHHNNDLFYLLLAIPGFVIWLIPSLVKRKADDTKQSIIALMAGDALHNAFTSILWLSLCITSGRIEFMIIPAMMLHEIPHKAGNFGIMIFSGISKKLALLLSISASLFFFTGLFLYQLKIEMDGKILIPIIIGTLTYTIYSGLKHEASSLRNKGAWIWLLSGIFLMIFVNLVTAGWH